MIAMLRSIRNTGNPEYHLRGREQHAAARQTLRALRERGFVVKGERLLSFKLTDSGSRVLLPEVVDAAAARFDARPLYRASTEAREELQEEER